MSAHGDHASPGSLTERFVELAFAADRLLGEGSIVDAYLGERKPPEAPLEADELIAELRAVADAAERQAGPGRDDTRSDLAGSARSLARFVEVHTDRFAGTYEEAVETILGAPLKRRTPAQLDALRSDLLAALDAAGYGRTWPDALERWQDDTRVEATEYLAAIEERAAHLRTLTHARVLVPVVGRAAADDILRRASVTFELVDTEETWAAYHVYEGGLTSRVEINRGRIFNRDEAAIFASHEVYPGHHTHSTVREHLYESGQAAPHEALTLLHTPGSLIDEGIGEYGRHFLREPLSARESAAYLHDRLITETRHGLALDVNAGRLAQPEATSLLATGAGISEERASKAISFARDWRYYFPAYTLGYDIVRNAYSEHGATSLRPLYTRKSATSIERALAAA